MIRSPFCAVSEQTIGGGHKAVTIENELLAITVLPEKGADIYRWIYKPRDMDVLWKSPWGLRHPRGMIATTSTTEEAWLEHYEGGWQGNSILSVSGRLNRTQQKPATS